VLRVDMPLSPTGPHIALLSVRTASTAQSDEARAIVRAARAPSLDGGTVLVTGQTAFDVDAVDYLVERTPIAVGFVTLTTMLALFFLLGSIVLPLKAVAMNALSVSASFGALVWIIQQGHLANLLNFTPQSIEPSLPVIMFCIMFGLSMDYEVLLLSRIQEEYRRTGDNVAAVAMGLERSGRLITGAAAIMVGVFVAFALADVVIIKSVGIGLTIAVLLDATLVRALVVPATMRLLGRANWWAPWRLGRGPHLEAASTTMDA
jgi:RND superfamily putative drug exporter